MAIGVLREWPWGTASATGERSERDACAACTVITLLRAPPRAPPTWRSPARGRAGPGGTPGSSLLLLLVSGEWGPPRPRALPPWGLTLLVPSSKLHSFEAPFSPSVPGWAQSGGSSWTDAWTTLAASCAQPGTGSITQSIPGLASARRPVKSGLVLSRQGEGLLDSARLCRKQGNSLHQEAAMSSRGSWARVLSNTCLIKPLRRPGHS